jgi:hypothetical protein
VKCGQQVLRCVSVRRQYHVTGAQRAALCRQYMGHPVVAPLNDLTAIYETPRRCSIQ